MAGGVEAGAGVRLRARCNVDLASGLASVVAHYRDGIAEVYTADSATGAITLKSGFLDQSVFQSR